jgi:hypothetical protein
MDLLCKRYASPFSFVDIAISQGRFCVFIEFLQDKNEESMEWQYYLHKVHDSNVSFENFRDRIRNISKAPKKIDFVATIEQSQDILNGFNPYS